MTQKAFPSSFAAIAADSGHVGYDWDLKADRLHWLGPWERLFGTSGKEPPHNAETLAAVVVPEDHYLVFNDGAPSFDREYRLRLPDGNPLWVHEHGTADFENGRTVRQRGLIRVIDQARATSRPTAQEVLARDLLTGRPNRAYMQAQLNRLLEGTVDLRQSSAYLVVSIDKMAFVNEAIGTKAVDAMLRGVADRLQQLIPARAVLARVGGDMFGILLPGLGREAAALAERILQNFHDIPVATPAAPFHITVSVGGVRLGEPVSGAPELMIRAEQALQEARQKGRNLYVEYQESPTRAQEQRALLELGERVKQALKQDRLRLAFQPVIEAQTGHVLFYEALARMFDENEKLIAAADFIPVVESQGLAWEFDRHVLNMAVRELEQSASLHLAVNISGLTAAQTDWPEYVQQVLGSRPAVAQRLIIEITETAAIMDVTETQRFAECLKQLGGQVALDDFGAGSTSIRHLRTLALAIMKIDRDLLSHLIENPEQQHLVRMLISIAKGLGLKTVAEGIETEDVAQWLRQEGIDMMQGYYFGRPSLDRPWLAKNGTAALENRTRQLLGLAPGVTELRVASVVQG